MTEQEITELVMSGKTVHECIVEAFGRGMEAKRVEVVDAIIPVHAARGCSLSCREEILALPCLKSEGVAAC